MRRAKRSDSTAAATLGYAVAAPYARVTSATAAVGGLTLCL